MVHAEVVKQSRGAEREGTRTAPSARVFLSWSRLGTRSRPIRPTAGFTQKIGWSTTALPETVFPSAAGGLDESPG